MCTCEKGPIWGDACCSFFPHPHWLMQPEREQGSVQRPSASSQMALCLLQRSAQITREQYHVGPKPLAFPQEPAPRRVLHGNLAELLPHSLSGFPHRRETIVTLRSQSTILSGVSQYMEFFLELQFLESCDNVRLSAYFVLVFKLFLALVAAEKSLKMQPPKVSKIRREI